MLMRFLVSAFFSVLFIYVLISLKAKAALHVFVFQEIPWTQYPEGVLREGELCALYSQCE